MSKQLFNSTESSNFILNLTEEKYSRIASKALLVALFFMALFTIPCELDIKHISYPIITAGLSIGGVACFILAIISFIKGYVKKIALVPIISFVFFLIWSVISAFHSYDMSVSFYGTDGRGEGIFAFLFYFSFFITALSIKTEKAISLVFDGIIIIGFVNCIWALPQIFIDSMPSHYDFVGLSGDISAASGLSQSPIFLATVLSICIILGIIGTMCFPNKKRRILYLIQTLLCSFVLIFTYSMVSIITLVLSIIIGVLTVILKKLPKINFIKISGIIVSSVLAVILIHTGVIGEIDKYSLHDGTLIWYDSYNRLNVSGIYDPNQVDLENSLKVYNHLDNKTMGIIKQFPIVGTGPENLVYPQLYSSYVIDENQGTFDKCYNSYLYFAATLGLPALIAFVVFCLSVIFIGSKFLMKNKKDTYKFTCFAIFIASTVVILFSNSNINYTPIFFIFAGLLCSQPEKYKKDF